MKEFFIGTDVGSTTVKIVCLDEEKNIVYSIYIIIRRSYLKNPFKQT